MKSYVGILFLFSLSSTSFAQQGVVLGADRTHVCGAICEEARADFGEFDKTKMAEIFHSNTVPGMTIIPVDGRNFLSKANGSWRIVAQNPSGSENFGAYFTDEHSQKSYPWLTLEFESTNSGAFKAAIANLDKPSRKLFKSNDVHSFNYKPCYTCGTSSQIMELIGNDISMTDPLSVGLDIKETFPEFKEEVVAQNIQFNDGKFQTQFGEFWTGGGLLAIPPTGDLRSSDSALINYDCKMLQSQQSRFKYLLCEMDAIGLIYETLVQSRDPQYMTLAFRTFKGPGARNTGVGGRMGYALFVYQLGVDVKIIFDPNRLPLQN